jgi:hypothetical protein
LQVVAVAAETWVGVAAVVAIELQHHTQLQKELHIQSL